MWPLKKPVTSRPRCNHATCSVCGQVNENEDTVIFVMPAQVKVKFYAEDEVRYFKDKREFIKEVRVCKKCIPGSKFDRRKKVD